MWTSITAFILTVVTSTVLANPLSDVVPARTPSPASPLFLKAAPGDEVCNMMLDKCFVFVYVLPPNVSPDGSPASTRCSTWLTHTTTHAGGKNERVVWILVEAMTSDKAVYRFKSGKAIKLDRENAFQSGDVEDAQVRKRYKWSLNKGVKDRSNYQILVETSPNGSSPWSDCDSNDPVIANEG